MSNCIRARSTSKTKLNFHDRLDGVRFLIKTRQDNDVVNRIGLAYPKIETELLGTIESMQFVTKTGQDNNVTNL